MSTKELAPLPFTFNITHTDTGLLLAEKEWNSSTGVPAVDFTVDVTNVVLGSGAAIALRPVLQFAATRTDRPDAAASISVGSDITAVGVTHFQETLSAASKFFFRRGLAYKVTAGSFARVEGILYTAFRSLGYQLPAEEIVFNPSNNTTASHYFPLGRGKPIPASLVDSAKLAVIGQGNLNANMQWRLAGRAFNDPLARGPWTELEAAWHSPQAGDFDVNTGEISLSALSLASYQWLELALAVRKAAGGDPGSQCIFQILAAFKYS
jgi:hypothetical protein